MARVVFSRSQSELTDGVETIDVEARRVQDLLRALYERFPALAGTLDDSAVAIDGNIHNDALYEPLAPDSEVHFLAPVAGG